MITVKVSTTKKRPNTMDYSSDAFSATLEVELPDAAYLNGNGDLRQTLAKLFGEVNAEVDSQIKNGTTPHIDENTPDAPVNNRLAPAKTEDATPVAKSPSRAPKRPRRSSNNGNGNGNGNGELATNKQVQYLTGLATRDQKMSLPELRAFVKRQVRKDDIYSLTKAEASLLIEMLKNGN